MNDLYELYFSASPMLNGQEIPSDNELHNIVLDELEEEYARLTREHDSMLEAGMFTQAKDLEFRLEEIDDTIDDIQEK